MNAGGRGGAEVQQAKLPNQPYPSQLQLSFN